MVKLIEAHASRGQTFFGVEGLICVLNMWFFPVDYQ